MKIAQHREKLKSIQEQVLHQEEIIKSVSNVISFNKDVSKIISECKKRAVNDSFKILIMGKFSAGKSTMINALLGEPILPSSPVPTTAIITVIRYSEEKKAVVHPIPGKWKGVEGKYKGGDSQFEVPASELRDFLKIDHRNKNVFGEGVVYKEGDVIYSPFDKMEIYWPLEILKDGVEIIDSPGLDDPTAHDKITKDYISNADAIIYCMSSIAAYTEKDAEEIKKIRLQGYKCPMYGITYYDFIRSNGQEAEEELKEYIDLNLSALSELSTDKYKKLLGTDGIFYLSSLEALHAKNPYDREKHVDSGYAEFEQYLENFLIKCAGGEKVDILVSMFKNNIGDCMKSINHYLSTADAPLEEFEAKYRAATGTIKNAEIQADLFVRELNLEINAIPDKIHPLAELFVKDLVAEFPVWRDSFETSVKTEVLHLKRTATAISEEFNAYLQSKIDSYTREWIDTKLITALNTEMIGISQKMNKRGNDLDEAIRNVKIAMDFHKDATDAGIGGNTSKIASFVYGLFTGDWITAGLGMALGGGAMLRGMGYQFIAGLALGVIALFTPVGLPAMLLATIAAAIAAGVRNVGLMQKNICNKIVSSYTENYSDASNVKISIDKIMGIVENLLESLKEEGKKAAFADIEQIKAEAERIIENKQKRTEDIYKDKEAAGKALQKLDQIKSELDLIAASK